MASILSIGAVLWDVLPDARHIGGAPFNVAAHAAKQGMESFILTGVGRDDLGEEAIKCIEDLKVNKDYIQYDNEKQTGVAYVTFPKPGMPEYNIPQDVAYNNIQLKEGLLKSLQERDLDFIYFGSMEQKSEVNRQTIKRILGEVKAKNIFFDVNIRFNFYPKEVIEHSFHASDIVKVNDEEALLISTMLYGEELPLELFIKSIAEEFGISIIILTLGSKGCLVYEKESGRLENIPACSIIVADTIGAGDAFCATFMNYYHKTGDPFKAAMYGNRMGAYVASKKGAIPEVDEVELEKLRVID